MRNISNKSLEDNMQVLNLGEELEDVELEEDLDSDVEERIFQDAGELEESWQEKCKKEKRKEEEDLDIKKEIRSWIITLGITFLLIFVLKNYVIVNAVTPSGSMENTIMKGDRYFANRLAYLFEEPQRGDIILFYFPDNEKEKYIKRIIGLPGEKVTIIDAKVYINDSKVPLDEPYLKEEWVNGTGPYEFEVPEGCYFVMGDNRNTSVDARSWNNKYVAIEKIIGKAGFIYYPFDRIGVVE